MDLSSELLRNSFNNLFDCLFNLTFQGDFLQLLPASNHNTCFLAFLLRSILLFWLLIFDFLFLQFDLDVLVVDGNEFRKVAFQILKEINHFLTWTEHEVCRVKLIETNDGV